MNQKHTHSHEYLIDDSEIAKNEKKTLAVVLLTATMMVVEIVYGQISGSMALLADGWHMASHAGALGIAYLAYKFAKSEKFRRHFSFGSGKFIPLGGFTSAIILAMVAFIMGYESIARILAPIPIHFNEAIFVAIMGLVVNLVSIFIFHDHEHEHHDHDAPSKNPLARYEPSPTSDPRPATSDGAAAPHDHNFRGAYLHVIADAMTSVFAIVALLAGKYYNLVWLDPFMGIVGSILILKWAYELIKNTGWELLDGHAKDIDQEKIRNLIENENTRIVDLHIWRIAPKAHACELVVHTSEKRGSAFYKQVLTRNFSIKHSVVEERDDEVRYIKI